MDIFSRAVDWVVTRTVNDEIHHYSVASRLKLSGRNSWEALPGDVFSVILRKLDSTKADRQTVGNLRLVCQNWRYHVESRLESLSLVLKSSTTNGGGGSGPLPPPVLRSFSNLRQLNLSCTFNADLDPVPLLKSVRNLPQLRVLDLRNSKGRFDIENRVQFLSGMLNLTELCLDGDTFLAMKNCNVSVPNLTVLTLQNCSNLSSSSEFQFLEQFSKLKSLKLIDACTFWKYGISSLEGGLSSTLEELAVMNYSKKDEFSPPSFKALEKVPNLKHLVLQESEMRMDQIESLPMLRDLHKISLYGCSEISVSLFNCLAQKCPILTHMKLGCFLDSVIENEFTGIQDLPFLTRLEVINCPNLDTTVLESSFRRDLELIHVPFPDTLLHDKAKVLDYSLLEEFLESCSSNDITGLPLFGEYFDPSVLTELSNKSCFDFVQLLVSYGADVDYGNPFLAHDSCHCYDCSTPLHFAVHKGDQQGVIDLLNLGARVNAHCSEDCRSPLHLAASTGNSTLTKTLIHAGANVNALDSLFRTPLHAAVSWGSTEVIAELIVHGADGSLVDHELLSPICYAARSGDLDLLSFLVQAGLGINEGMKYDLPTPLHIAVKRGRYKMVKFLLENGGKPEAKDVSGSSTPLFVAARHGHRALLALLLKHVDTENENLDSRDETGNTLLHYSASYGWMDIVEMLIQMGVDVNRTDPKGFTALYYADMQRHLKIVSRLAKEGGLARWITHPRIYKRQQKFKYRKITQV
eukprot:g4096.t1